MVNWKQRQAARLIGKVIALLETSDAETSDYSNTDRTAARAIRHAFSSWNSSSFASGEPTFSSRERAELLLLFANGEEDGSKLSE